MGLDRNVPGLYYNSPSSREDSLAAHDRIVAAARAREADLLVAELGDHRRRALAWMEEILTRRG